MKIIFRLNLIFLFFITQTSFGQDTTAIINYSWTNLRTEIQHRNDIVSSLISVISKSKKTDKRLLSQTKSFATSLFLYIDTLRQIDNVSISIATKKNNDLTESLRNIYIEMAKDQKFNKKHNVPGLNAQLEAVENSIALKKTEYNQTCKKYNRLDLLFSVPVQTERASEIKF